MKFALVDGRREEARPGLSGSCPSCESALIARCGTQRVWHWAHRSQRQCDHWWESETEWHRAWKNHFPIDWQEVIHKAQDGEKHIADVKTEHGLVIEFQHSFLPAEERQAREAFYRPMAWLVDGLRLKPDKRRFTKAVRQALAVTNLAPLTLIVRSDGCAILRDWVNSRVPVYLDFGDTNDLEDIMPFKTQVLWLLHPQSSTSWSYLTPVYRTALVKALGGGIAYEGMPAISFNRNPSPACPYLQRRPLSRRHRTVGFEQYVARKDQARRRRRF